MRRLIVALTSVLPSIVALPLTSDAALLRVAADESGDYPTIQEAIDVAKPGDFIQLEAGTYRGAGNRDLTFGGKDIVVIGFDSSPEACVIDCEGSAGDPHRGFIFENGETDEARVEGITVLNGYADTGAAVVCMEGSSPTFLSCVFLECVATTAGGGAFVADSSPTFTNCVFEGNSSEASGGGLAIAAGPSPVLFGCRFIGNSAADAGGGIHGHGSSAPHIMYCTFSGNAAGTEGGGIFVDDDSLFFIVLTTLTGNAASTGAAVSVGSHASLVMNDSIVAFNADGAAVACGLLSQATLGCCVVYGNAGGDWVDCLAGQDGQLWNLNVDPEFCSSDPDADRNWTIQIDSPCMPTDDCDYRGAWQEGCGTSPVEDSTWGRIKAAYRIEPSVDH